MQGGGDITREIFGDEMDYLPWMRPGFELGLAMREICQKNSKAQAIMMGQHGFISWADDDKECYTETLRSIETAAAYIEAKYEAKGGHARAFGGAWLVLKSTIKTSSGVTTRSRWSV